LVWTPFVKTNQIESNQITRIRLAQFRTGSHWLGVETGLWANLPREQLGGGW